MIKFKLLIIVLFCLTSDILFSMSKNSLTVVPDKVDGVSNIVYSLNGKWRFSPKCQKGYQNLENTNKLIDINVPGEWRMQGFKVKSGERAAYYKSFKLPESWSEKNVCLRFDALHSDAEIWLNGKLLGRHTGVMTPCEFLVSDKLNRGKENILVVGLKSESLADTLASYSQYATHQSGGIIRKVYLFAVSKKACIKSQHYETIFDKNYKNAVLKVFTKVNFNKKSYKRKNDLDFKLKGNDEKEVILKLKSVDKQHNGNTTDYIHNFEVINPEKWTCETPNLYKLKTSLKVGKKHLETISINIGFRTVEVVGNVVFVNGKRIKLKGVNRHETHPLMGRSLNMELWKKDATMFLDANVNYIRTSHYPPSEEFVQLCDSLGLFVELEAPFCWVGHGANNKWKNNNPHNHKYYEIIENSHNRMLEMYRNSPSVIIWSMANESAWGKLWAKAYQNIKSKDKTRPVTFHDQAYGGYNNYGSDICDIANMHYPGPRGPKVAKDFKRPLLFGEYAHLNTYNRSEIITDPGVRDMWGKPFRDMWDNMYYSKGCLGGAIWSGIDDFFYLPSGKAVGYGEWGPVDAWRREKPEYWHMKKSYSPVKIYGDCLKISDNIIKLVVENRFDFISLSEVDINWSLSDKYGKIKSYLNPGETGVLQINIDNHNDITSGSDLVIEIKTKSGRLIDKYSFLISENSSNNIDNKGSKVKYSLTKDNNRYIVYRSNERWIIDKTTGLISNASVNGREVISQGNEFMMLPLKSGECKTEHSLNIPVLNDRCKGWKQKSISYSYSSDTLVVDVEGEYDMLKGKYSYMFLPSGKVELDYDFISNKDINPRQFGIVFTLDRDFDLLKWQRKGVWSYYPSNHIGRCKGEAKLYSSVYTKKNSWTIPKCEWYHDQTELGTNDFRSTKSGIIESSLEDGNGNALKVLSDGSHFTRSFYEDSSLKLLVGDFNTGGNDIFYSSHHKHERRPIKKGDRVKGKVLIKIQ